MSVIVRGIDIPTYGCSECPLAHKVFNGAETVLACFAVQKETSDDGERPNWCPLQDVVTCAECKNAMMTVSGECKYCKLDEDENGNIEASYYPGDYFCGSGERRA